MPHTMLDAQKPLSLLHHAQVHNLDPRWVLLNAPNLLSSFYYRKHEFSGTLLAADWSTAVTAGGAPTAFAYNAQRNGALRGATGITDNGITAIHQANVAMDSADNPAVFIRFRNPDTPSGFAFEIGWSDAKTDEKLVSVSALSAAAVPTITNGITDFGLVVFNTDLTLQTVALIGDGTTGTVVGTKVGPTWTPTASKIVDMIIGVSPNLTTCQIWEDNTYIGQYSLTNGPDSGTLVRFSALFKTLDTTTDVVDILKIVILAEENAT